MDWMPIDTAPLTKKPMFVVIGIDVKVGNTTYTTDPYCVWRREDGKFVRWMHPFPPTHWLRLPDIPGATDA
jgi:hypothetical protein